jgi:hypothetical protein
MRPSPGRSGRHVDDSAGRDIGYRVIQEDRHDRGGQLPLIIAERQLRVPDIAILLAGNMLGA